MNEFIESLNITDSDILNAMLVMAAFIIIAVVVLYIVKILKKLATFTKSDFDDKVLNALQKPLFFTILILGLIAAIKVWDFDPKVFQVINRIGYSLVVLIWGWASVRIINLIIKRALSKAFDVTGLSTEILPLIDNLSKVLVILGAILMIFSIWEIDITAIVTTAGVASIIIALAAKDTAANFFGGISVFFDKPYKIGDYINLDTGERGEVVDIGMRSTRIKTRDDIMVTIPNAIIANSKIVNESSPTEMFRCRIPIGVAYGSDVDLVEDILIDIASNNENIRKEPEPRVRFRKFGESSLDFELLCWAIEPSLRGLSIHEINKQIYRRFKENNIAIPFPQRDLHIIEKPKGKENG
jgi:MscS family membrane protein